MKKKRDGAALLARAIAIAATIHEEQKDKAGAPYILHPLRMMARADTLETQIVAVLHDVAEDSADAPEPYTVERLRDEEGFSDAVMAAVDLLTRRRKETHGRDETYEEFVQRIVDAEGPAGALARRVKLLDLEDNMTVTRLSDELTDDDVERLRRYQRAHRRIKDKMAEPA